MSEEDIIEYIKKSIKWWDEKHVIHFNTNTLQGLLDLYSNTKKSEEILANKLQNVNIELNNLKEIEQQHKTDNGLLRQELDMQIEHNKELDKILYAKQSMIDELTQNEEQLKIELGKEKENLKIAVAMLTKGTYPEENEGDNDFNKQFIAVDKIKEMKKYREFELQQEYKEFEEDVEWRTYKKILEEK